MSAGAQQHPAADRLASLIAATPLPCGTHAGVTPIGSARTVHERIAGRLAWVRGCAHLTRRELALIIAAGEPASIEQRLWRYETGRAAPPVALLVRLAEIFNVSVELFTSESIMAAELHTWLRRHPQAAAQLLDEFERGNPGRSHGPSPARD